MKSILISIKLQYVCDILNGKKTIEIRKTYPHCDLPIKVYIYCTKERYKGVNDNVELNYCGKVVACFTLNKVEEIDYEYREDFTSVYTDTLDTKDLELKACLTRREFANYLDSEIGYAWHISNLEIFDTPRPLQPYFDLDRPPQSWQFMETTIKLGSNI